MPTESLTAARVESLAKRPPAAGRVEVWDAKTPGLALRISATGAASWSFRWAILAWPTRVPGTARHAVALRIGLQSRLAAIARYFPNSGGQFLRE